jgi:hypothetical protein
MACFLRAPSNLGFREAEQLLRLYKSLKNNGARAAYDGHRMVAFVDPKTGVSKVFRSLEALKPGRGLAERVIAAIPTTQERVMGREDAKEGIRSFVERRPAQRIGQEPSQLFRAPHTRTDCVA